MEYILDKISLKKTLCVSWLLVLIAIFSYFIVKDAALILGDDRQFLPLLRDNSFLYGWFGDHRFWPLGLADYNIFLLMPTFKNPIGFYTYNAIVMSIFIIIMFQLLYKITLKYTPKFYIESTTIILTSLILSSNFLNIHISIIFPERMIIFMFSIFISCAFYGKNKQSTALYLVSFLAATYATYCKEIIFGMITIIALTNLIFDKKLSKKDFYFLVALLLESLIYIITYFIITCGDSGHYGRPLALNSSIEMLRNVFKENLYLCIIFGLGVFRGYRLIFKKEVDYILSDSFLFAGCAYVLAYFILHLYCGYYFVPSIVLALPSIAIFLGKILEKQTKFWKLFSILLILCPALQCVMCIPNLIKETLLQRKYIVPKTIDYLVSSSKNGNIFMLDSTNDTIVNSIGAIIDKIFSSFLNYYVNAPFDNSAIKKITSQELYKITKDDMLIIVFDKYKKEDSQKITEFLILKNFSLIYSNCCGVVYKPKGIKTIDVKKIYNFDDKLGSDYFCLIGLHNGIFVKSNNPAIIMNLKNGKDYKLSLDICAKNSEFWTVKLGNKIIFKGEINVGKLILNYKILKEDIPENGKVVVKFEPNLNINSRQIKALEDLLHNVYLDQISIEPI